MSPLVAAAALLAAATAARAAPGDPDPDFATGSDASDSVHALARQADRKILVGGVFTTYHDVSRDGLVRLNTDGTIDTFSTNLVLTGYNGGAVNVSAIVLQANGDIIVGGQFSPVGQTAGAGVARLTAAGALDKSFNAGTGVVNAGDHVGQVYALARLSSGELLVGGDFSTFNGTAKAGIVLLKTDGSLDIAFNKSGAGITGNSTGRAVKAIAVQSDGRILIAGEFSAYDGFAAGCVARLNTDGTPDKTFSVGEGADESVNAVAVQNDGKILIGGGYNNFDGAALPHLLRLTSTGGVDTGYDPDGSGLLIQEVDAILVQPDGTALAGGVLRVDDGLVNTPHNGVMRVLADGTQDGGFDSGTDSRQAVALAVQDDGKALVASNVYSLGAAPGNVFRIFDISPPPVITSALTATAYLGTAFSYQITATEDPLSFGAASLPPGLSVNTDTGRISGTPTKTGTYSVTIAAFNDDNHGSAKLTLTVTEAVPKITSSLNPPSREGVPFAYQITATSSPTSYATQGLPAGLGVSKTTGKISGTPTKAGTYNVKLSATNGGGTGTATLSLVVKQAVPVVTSSLNPPSRQGVPFGYQITATNDPTSYTASGLPAGLGLSKTTGKISGTPTKAGPYTVTIGAANSGGAGTAKLDLVVKPPN